jgi:hypothetical protein
MVFGLEDTDALRGYSSARSVEIFFGGTNYRELIRTGCRAYGEALEEQWLIVRK